MDKQEGTDIAGKESEEDKDSDDNSLLLYKTLQQDIDKTLNNSKKSSEENKKITTTCRLLSMLIKKEIDETSEEETKGGHNKITNILRLLSILIKQNSVKDKEKDKLINLAARLGCSVPALKKYMKEIKRSFDIIYTLEDMRFSINFDREESKYKFYSDTKFLVLTVQEMKTLYETVRCFSRQFSVPFKGLNNLEKKIYSTIEKDIRENLNKPVEISGPQIKRNLSVSLDMINEAINERYKLEISYIASSHKDPVIRKIVPYSLMFHNYEWYIRAFCLQDKIVKTFTINQIVRMEIKKISKSEVELLPDNPEAEPEHMWDWKGTKEKEVKIKFTGNQAEIMKKKLQYRTEHPSQRFSMSGKDLIVFFKVKNPSYMISWILQFKSSAEVIEPESLRIQIKKTLISMQSLY